MKKSTNVFNLIFHFLNEKIKNIHTTLLVNKRINENSHYDIEAFLNAGYTLSKKQREKLYKKSKDNFFGKSSFFDDKKAKNHLLSFAVNKENINNPEIYVAAIFTYFSKFDYYYYNFKDEKYIRNIFFNPKEYEKFINFLYKNKNVSYIEYGNIFIYSSFKEYIVKNKDLLLFINKFINKHKEAFILSVMEMLSNNYENIPVYFMNNFHHFIDLVFPDLSDDLKSIVISTYVYYENKKSMGFDSNVKDFIGKNMNYYNRSKVISYFDKSVFDKDSIEKDAVKKEKIVSENKVNIEKLLENKGFTQEIKDLCFSIMNNYEKLVENKAKVSIEAYITIENLVDNKIVLILNNYISAHELNKIFDNSSTLKLKDSEEYKLCVKSLNGINNMIYKELEFLRKENLNQMKVLDKYIYTER